MSPLLHQPPCLGRTKLTKLAVLRILTMTPSLGSHSDPDCDGDVAGWGTKRDLKKAVAHYRVAAEARVSQARLLCTHRETAPLITRQEIIHNNHACSAANFCGLVCTPRHRGVVHDD